MKKSRLFFLLIWAIPFMAFAQSYQNVESAEYDEANNRFLISNGNSILARASNGSLSFFGSGSANYGMEVLNNTLFAISGTSIKGYDLSTEAEVMSHDISGAAFLNGLTNDGVSKLYATDFGGKKIYEIDVSDLNNPSSSVVVPSTAVTPNGIIYDGDNNRLLFVSWGANAAILAVDLADFSISKVRSTSFSNIDGIDEDNTGNYYISTWTPSRIHKYNKDFTGQPETISTPGIPNPADIGYAKAIDTLAIPTGGNNVVFVGFDPPVSNQNISKEETLLSVYPNPITAQSVLEFELSSSQRIDLSIYDMKGQVIKNLLNGEQAAGKHKVLFAGIPLPVGMHHCRLETESGQSGQLKVLVLD